MLKLPSVNDSLSNSRIKELHCSLFKEDDNPPLHLAVNSNKRDAIKSFVKAGVNVDSKNKKGNTPLFVCAKENKKDMVKFLLEEAGAEVNCPNSEGNTPLHIAAFEGNNDVVDALLAHGASVSVQNEKHQNPLHFAARRKKVQIVQNMMKCASLDDLTKTDKTGKKPVDYARDDEIKDILNRKLYELSKFSNQTVDDSLIIN